MNPIFSKFKGKFTKEKFSIGLDIGSDAVKLIKLQFNQDKPEISYFAIEPAKDNLVEVLKTLRQKENQDNVNIAISGPSTVIRYINFPRMSQFELRQALKFEVQKHIPFSASEINFDGFILKEDMPENKMLVLIAAVKKDMVGQRLKLIEDAGFMADIIDVDSIALINSFNFNYSGDENIKHKTICLLNVGSSISNLNILEDGMPRLSRDMHIAGSNFTQRLAENFGLDFKDAENLKINQAQAQETEKVSTVLQSIFTGLAGEIRTSFDYYESQSSSSVSKIFLSGGGSKVAGLKDTLASLISIELDYWDPLRNLVISNNVNAQKLKEINCQLAVATGLALRQ